MRNTRNSLALRLAVVAAFSAVGCSNSGLTESVALERLRADKNLPVPAEELKIVGIGDGEGERIVKVDFGGTTANVKFRRFDKRWSPEQFETAAGGWVSLSAGFAMLTETEERTATSYLKSLVGAQAAYAATCGAGYYSPSLTALATPPPGEKTAFVVEELMPVSGSAFVEKAHYRIEMSTPASAKSPPGCNGVPAGTSGETWSATAVRKKGAPGNSYKVLADGQISLIQ